MMGTSSTPTPSLESRADDIGSSRVQLCIPARAEYISLGRLALTGLSQLRELPDETLADLKLALTEACSNAVRHAYRGDREGIVEIVYDLQPDRLVIEVSDDGAGFDDDEAVGEDGEPAEGGLGLAIIRSLSDEFEVGERSSGGGLRLRFVKKLP